MSIPNLRAIRDWCKERISGVEKSLVINGVQLYLDYQDGKYGVNTDPERGPNTFTPFIASGEGSGGTSGTTPEQPDNPPQEEEEVIQKIKAQGVLYLTPFKKEISNMNQLRFYLEDVDISKIEKITINKIFANFQKNAASMPAATLYFSVKYLSADIEQEKALAYAALQSTDNIYTIKSLEMAEQDYDFSSLNASKILYFILYVIPSSTTAAASAFYYVNNVEIDVDVKYKGI